jgi:hypothetical protein
VALGGTAYAAAAAKNSVTSKAIKKGAVRSGDIRNNGVKGVDVDEASLDFAGLTELVGPQGSEGPRGPAGADGADGAEGERGAVGPTFGTVLQNNSPVPPANPDTAVLNGQFEHTFETPSAGRLLVFASIHTYGVTCSAGNADGYLYLDGVGVPNSGVDLPTSGAGEAFTPIAVTGVVPAGEHTLRVSHDCPAGNPTSDSSSGSGDLGAVLLGG